jgi:HSP20 family protein
MVTSLIPRGFGREMLSSIARDPFRALQTEFDDVFDQFLSRRDGAGKPTAESYIPSLNLSEIDSELQITMDVPGVKPEEVDIEVTGNTVRVRGEHKEENEEKGRTYHRLERRTGSFFRAIELPCEVKRDKVVADYKDGVLKITLPKCEVTKPHKVTVKGNGK